MLKRFLFPAAAFLLFAAWPATAQVTRLDAAVPIPAATRGSAIAFDSVNSVYLAVSTFGTLRGRFISSDGVPLGDPFVIQSSANYTHFPRVAFSPHANGGNGAFLVSWHESDGPPNSSTSVHARLVAYSGLLIGADHRLSGHESWWESGAPVAYATGSREFLVAWRVVAPNDIRAIRVSNTGAPIGDPIPVTASGAANFEDHVSVAYSPAADDFMVLYAGYTSYSALYANRVKAGTGGLGAAHVLATAVGIYDTDIEYNPAAGNYLAVWYQDPPKAIYGIRVGPDGAPSGSVQALSSRYKAYDAVALALNRISGTYFMISHDSLSAEDGGVEIDGAANPLTSGVQVTATGGIGNFHPRLAAHTSRREWLAVASNAWTQTISQRLQTGSTGGGGGGGGGGTPTRRVGGDFTGDGRADLTVYRPSSGTWSVLGGNSTTWGQPGDIPVSADYDGDGRVDFAVYRPSNGLWFIQGAPFVKWGIPGDLPVPADYNGDGRADIAVFRPSNGHWYIRGLAGSPVHYGRPGDLPVPGDYNGDGTVEIAIFRRATGAWWIYGNQKVDYGLPGDMPVPADYDGNGTTDIAVYRPGDGNWHVRGQFSRNFGGSGLLPVPMDVDGDGKAELVTMNRSTGEWKTYNRATAALDSRRYGQAGDLPPSPILFAMLHVTGDADGDRKADPTVVRPSTGTWYPRQSSTGGYLAIGFGLSTDIPVSADYDGDGKLDAAVFRPSTGVWYVSGSAGEFSSFFGSDPLGGATDTPLAGDFDGDGRADMAIFRPSTAVWYIRSSTTNYLAIDSFTWGQPGDIPVAADYDGDGRKDPAVFRPSTGSWLVYLRASGSSLNLTWGQSGDKPVPADFDGDGRADLVLYRGGRWLFRYSSAEWTTTESNVLWGLADDLPIAADFDGDGHADVTVFRPSTGRWFIVGNGYYDFGGPGDVVAIKQ